jgi:Ca-activated chloride channel family protein
VIKTHSALSLSAVAAGQRRALDALIELSAAGAQVTRRPLNLSLVLDRSGSMGGSSLTYAVRAARDLVNRMTADDTLSVVIYDDTVETLVAPTKVTDKDALHAALNSIRAGGLTNLSGGWLRGCELVKQHLQPDAINRVLLLTDGQANEGITDPKVIVNTAKKQAAEGVITTTLGFGSYFNEDLLIDMASAAEGHFYFIQSPDEASDVFRIEIDSIASLAAQNLTATLTPRPGTQVIEVLNPTYKARTLGDGRLEVSLGDINAIEPHQLSVALSVEAPAAHGPFPVLDVAWRCDAVRDGAIQALSGDLTVEGTSAAEDSATPNAPVLEQASQLRISRAKDEAVKLADKGDAAAAADKLRAAQADLKLRWASQETFTIAEELDQLDHFATQIARGSLHGNVRKELRDQSFQAATRQRADLKLRGVAGGSTDTLPDTQDASSGVVVECVREGGKLRIRAASDGYDPALNVQFPRSIREEGARYVVESLTPSADGGFYRAGGAIKLLLAPGQTRRAASTGRAPRNLQAAKAPRTVNDLETTTDIGDCVLVQCVQEKGGKLRARVVSDGYDPNMNMSFPRDIRQVGILYVVDEVRPSSDGKSYRAYGKIKRLVQPTT